MSLYIDLSEFLTNPITTGIQRITGELCKYAPPGMLTPVRLDSGKYLAFPPDLIGTIGEYFRQGSQSGAAEIYRLGDFKNGKSVAVTSSDTVLVPEVFDNPQRLAFFREMPEQELQRYRFIIFDMLPLTHPQYFWADKLGIYEYFKMLRRASNCGFISENTRQVYYRRMKRTDACGGVVLPLGCDALGPRPARPVLDRPLTFSVIGTVEPRKNHQLILEAFEPLLRQIKGLTLSFVGRMGWVSSEFAQKVHALTADKDSGFQFYSAPGDEAIRKCIEESRATLYVSTAEGYGLPPVESLWVGTPVIASNASPSLNELASSAGIHYVEPLTVMNLRRAVLAFLDDAYANQKVEEIAHLNLPTWRSFTQEVLRWCEEDEVKPAAHYLT
jgi:glycosyltransferase involved in cell wall biosynthesis